MTNYRVIRYGIDRLRVLADDKQVLDVSMALDSPLHPESAAAAKARPWFYTGSPYGKEIMDLAWERDALLFYKVQLLDHAATQVRHEFWEASPNRKAMEVAQSIMKQMDNPSFVFVGERNDGLWICFTCHADADQFKALRG